MVGRPGTEEHTPEVFSGIEETHMRRNAVAGSTGFLLVAVLMASPASAQVFQGLQFGGGAFLPRQYDSRVAGDVLNEDLNSLAFRISDFKSGQVFGEWLLAFGNHVEVAAGVGYYQGSAPSVYASLTHPDGSEIQQTLRLRTVPITGIVRFLPFGTPSHVQPYVGVGVAATRFRYTESGEFVDYSDYSTFQNRYIATGTAVGPVVLGGLRVPIGGDIWGFTVEWRYTSATGTTGGAQNGFLADKIDLSGSNVNFALLVRF
jgi:hypothetical protein